MYKYTYKIHLKYIDNILEYMVQSSKFENILKYTRNTAPLSERPKIQYILYSPKYTHIYIEIHQKYTINIHQNIPKYRTW